jgi:Holliday junction resolvasome RuvABC ATP-dependent DNA helicase subunit
MIPTRSLNRASQGRVATKSAYEHLGVEFNEETQPKLL